MNQIRNIVILGAGNVGTHLSKSLFAKGFNIVQLYNRTEEKGMKLARLLETSYSGSIDEINPAADLYMMALSDSSIPEIASRLKVREGLVVHTSGSVGMDVLNNTSRHIGVFYPLQTFREMKRVSFSNIPICIEGNLPGVEKKLDWFARQLSSNVHVINSEQRKMLHLTAVFAGNFTNYLYTIAQDLLLQYEIPFELLKPLIKQTAANVRHSDLFSLQTGPAVREDTAIIEEHLKLLENQVAYKKIYDLISKQIIKHKHKHGKL